MYRTLCVLVLWTLQAGLVHCFSWDIVVAAKNKLEFYNEGKVTYSVTFIDVDVDWITYDPFHNRVLFTNNSRSLLSFDIATGESQTLIIDLKPNRYNYFMSVESHLIRFQYDPATSLLYAMHSYKVYSYLVKTESNNEVDANFVFDSGETSRSEFAVDSCAGYIYWIRFVDIIKRARINGSDIEVIKNKNSDGSTNRYIVSLTIDPQTQNMYWMEYDTVSRRYFILSADLNGTHRRTIYSYEVHGHEFYTVLLTISNDFIYWAEFHNFMIPYKFFWKIPKNLPIGTDVEATKIAFSESSTASVYSNYIAANYAIEEQTRGIPLCKALKRLLPDYSETNDSDSLNVSTGGSLLHVNETKVSGESRDSGDTSNVPVCKYYCLQGNCSVSADGQPKCRCNAGYKGVRCEVNACQAYCLHGGVCSLSEQNNPVCQCTAGYQGERCDVPDFLIKCSETVSSLKDILNADLTSVTEGTGVKSTCASTVV